MKTRIFNLIILDESGSMNRVRYEAVTGVNETVQSIVTAQKENENQEHFVSLVIFNNFSRTVYDRVPAQEVSEFTEKQYAPKCLTALYDAMGMSLLELKKYVADADRVLVTVITDGLENASREFDGSAVKQMVEELKAKGWVFTYIGANHNVEEAAMNLSITNSISFQTTAESTRAMFERDRRCRRHMYDIVCSEEFCPEEANKSFFRK